jgi:peptide/nickel transport system substrate-binding protein
VDEHREWHRWSVSRVQISFGLLAAVSFLVAVGTVAGATTSADGRYAKLPALRVGITTSADPNPAKFSGVAAPGTMAVLAYEPLLIQKTDGSFGPGLATSWRYVSSRRGANKDFELTLRRNARFSDGTSVTASAVAGYMKYWMKTSFPNEVALLGPNPTITTVGKWKVQIHLTVPNPGLPSALSQYPLSLGWVASPKAVRNPSVFAGGGSFGAGPYMLQTSRTVIGDHYTYVPNPNYYNKSAIKWREIDVKVISNASSMLQALRSGQLDVAYGDVTTTRAAASAGLNVITAPYGAIGFWCFGLAKGKLKDVRVRQAISYAINRKPIAKTLLGGSPSSEMPTFDGSDPKYQNYYSYDPTKAKALLAAAGYPNGLTLTAVSDAYAGAVGDPVVQAVAKDLDAVGVRLEITPAKSLGELINALGGQYDLVQVPFQGFPTLATYLFYFAPKTGFISAVAGLNDVDMARLYYRAIKSANAKPYWKQIMGRVTTQAYAVVVGTTSQAWYTSKKVGGIKISLVAPAANSAEWYPK